MNIPAPLRLLPKQAQFLQAPQRYIGYFGGFGSGKTYVLCLRAIQESLKYPRNLGLLGCQTYPMLRDTVQRTFFDLIHMFQKRLDEEQVSLDLEQDFRVTEGRFTFPNRSEILFRSLGDPHDVGKLKSLNLGWAGIDEPTDIPYDTFRMLQGRLRLPDVSHHVFMTGNPSSYSSWVYKAFYDREEPDPNYIHFDAASTENKYLPSDYVEDLKRYDEAYYRRYVLGQWGNIEGLVYKEFRRDVHVVQPYDIPLNWTRLRSIDFGYTNPFVCLWVAVSPDEEYIVYREHYATQRLIKEHAETILSFSVGETYEATYADPSAAQERHELTNQGVYSMEAHNDVVAGIQTVQAKLKVKPNGRPSLFIFNTCPQTIKEFELYKWQQPRGDQNRKEEPLKQFDHAMDALRYAIYSHQKSANAYAHIGSANEILQDEYTTDYRLPVGF